ncbi:MAG: SDR family oxidoreductase [Odoribacteraceae bacterium]|jgi:NAD(P)-dependent dehydrogenase (short-subunit alcohol dehydrogenase family)|nr:SDR family oxidoreductase [Odoribacteraceae bacterium]
MQDNLFNIEGKVIVITGGCGVLGTSMSHYLARQGARVVILDRDSEKGEALAQAINDELKAINDELKPTTVNAKTPSGEIKPTAVNAPQKTGDALYLPSDVLDAPTLERNREEILSLRGRVDVLVNAAGGNMPGATIPPEKTIFDLQIDAFKKVVDLNLFGTVLPTITFARAMVAGGSGNIINIASESSLRPLTRVAGYGAAKAAVANFTKYMAGELALKFGERFRVNAMAPGFFITEQNRTLLTNPDGTHTDRARTILAHTPYNRFGEPDELLGTLHYLVSDASRFVSGAILVIDGGFDAFSI